MQSPPDIAATIADAMNKLKSGQVAEAISALEQASAAAPDDPQVHTCLGVAYTNKGDKAGAVTAFEKALGLERSARGHYNLGLAYESVGRSSEALVQYRSAVALDNNYMAARQAVERLSAAPPPAAEPTLIGQAAQNAGATQSMPVGPPPVAPVSDQTILDVQPDFSSIFKPSTAPPDLAREAYEKQMRAEQQRRDYMKAAVLYGAGCGAGFMLLLYLCFVFLLSAAAIGGAGLLLICLGMVIQGAIMGAIVGWWIGYTCGEDLQGALAGAVMGGLYGLITGLIAGAGTGALFGMVWHAFLGAIFGFFVGKMVESSIGY